MYISNCGLGSVLTIVSDVRVCPGSKILHSGL